MVGPTRYALFAFSAAQVNFTYYPFSNPFFLGSFYHLPNKLMAGDSCIWIITIQEFQIGSTYPSQVHTNKNFTHLQSWDRD
jgi:hypothetical protein